MESEYAAERIIDMEKKNNPVFRYGQILTSKVPTEVEKFGGEKVSIPVGNRVIVGFDGFAHHLNSGCIQPFAKDVQISGFCGDGIVEILYRYLSAKFPLEDMLSDYDFTENDFKEEMSYALDEIGLTSDIEWSTYGEKEE